MINDNRSIEDVMMQLSSSYESIRVVMKHLIKKHMKNSMNKGLVSTNPSKRDEAYNDLVGTIFKYIR